MIREKDIVYMNNKLTVIIPLYNEEKYIKQCIESIANQSYKDIDILIIDDGSTDNSYDICSKLAEQDDRINIIRQENMGPSRARKAGIACAKTEYVTFVDADDFILPNAYIWAEDAMKKNIDMIFFEISRYFDDENVKREYHILEEGYYDNNSIEQQVYSKLIWDFSRNTPGIECSQAVYIVKKTLLMQAYQRLNICVHYGEDAAITYPLYTMINNMQVINQSFYMHRQRKDIVASYIKDSGFLDKTYSLYNYLKLFFSPYFNQTEFEKQIEYFYMYSVNLRKMAYNDYNLERQFLFPFNKIGMGKSIILYGAGMVGKSYYDQVSKLNYCKDILWVDKNAAMMADDRIHDITDINDESYDYILIAIENQNICKQVYNELLSQGIEQSKIIY